MIFWIIGFVVGLLVGVFAVSLAVVAGRSDRAVDKMMADALRSVDLSPLDE